MRGQEEGKRRNEENKRKRMRRIIKGEKNENMKNCGKEILKRKECEKKMKGRQTRDMEGK